MKRIMSFITLFVLLFVFTGCTNDVYVEPNTIAVQYENVRWEGSSIVVDVWITNGYDEDYYLDYIEIALYFPNEDIEFCGSGFYPEETISANGFVDYEIEFESDYVFFTDTDLSNEGITLDDLELYFWIEE